MSRAVRWLTKRCRTRLDVMGMFGLAAAMGVTDMAAARLRRLAGRSAKATGDEAP
jgi:hypothetical protein